MSAKPHQIGEQISCPCSAVYEFGFDGRRNIAAATPVISMSRMVLGDTKSSDSNVFLPLFDVSEVAPTVH
jgi:hypothetical protein